MKNHYINRIAPFMEPETGIIDLKDTVIKGTYILPSNIGLDYMSLLAVRKVTDLTRKKDTGQDLKK